MTRVAYVAVRPDELAASTVSFVAEAVAFFAELGVRVERVMTDRRRRWRTRRLRRDLGAR